MTSKEAKNFVVFYSVLSQGTRVTRALGTRLNRTLRSWRMGVGDSVPLI